MKDQTVLLFLQVHHILEDVTVNSAEDGHVRVLVHKQENISAVVKALASRNNNKKGKVFIFGPEQSGQSFSRQNPMLSSAKDLIYLFQKADGHHCV